MFITRAFLPHATVPDVRQAESNGILTSSIASTIDIINAAIITMAIYSINIIIIIIIVIYIIDGIFLFQYICVVVVGNFSVSMLLGWFNIIILQRYLPLASA